MGRHGADPHVLARHGGAPLLHADFDRFVAVMDSPERAAWQRPDELVASLGLKPGQAVADIGAGTGYFTFRLARAVGPTGRVYAVDVDDRFLKLLLQRKQQNGARQVTVLKTTPDSPGLPRASVDLAFLCDTYHHIGDRVRWLRKLRRALRPGGRLVNVDFFDGPLPVGPPPSHKLPEAQVRREFAAAGFRLVEERRMKYQYVHIFSAEPNER